jgi:hypothetical protein
VKTHDGDREELLRKAGAVRSHMVANLEEYERKSHERIIMRGAGTGGGETVRTEEAATSTEREKLESKSDRVRNHLIDRIERIEVKARERILPIVIAGSVALAFLTVGFGVLLYRSLKS